MKNLSYNLETRFIPTFILYINANIIYFAQNEKVIFNITGLSLIIHLIAIYGFGYILNRMSSLFENLILRKFKIIKYNNDYNLFSKALKENPRLDVISRNRDIARVNFMCYLKSFIFSCYILQFSIISCAYFILLLISFASYFSINNDLNKKIKGE